MGKVTGEMQMNITVYLGANEGSEPALQQAVEVGDHILHLCQVDKFLGDEDKKGLYAWKGFGKVAPAAEG